MSITSESKISIPLPGRSLQQMTNFVAIAETSNQPEVLRKLILHTLFTFEQEKASTIQEVAAILETIFGLAIPNHQVQEAFDNLKFTGQIQEPFGTTYVLSQDVRKEVKERIDRASQLQEQVKMQWLAEIVGQFPGLDLDMAWEALRDYLATAFLRHGIQVAAFLDPSVGIPEEYATSLSTLLADAVRSKFDLIHHQGATHALSNFLANAGKNLERALFISECADGAANFFSLAVSPEVATRFREKLNAITLFCDTNFLFGILDLHVHPLVQVSNELLGAIAKHSLPLTLQYHTETFHELLSSISHYGDILRRHKWSRALSRAATTSHFMSGVELKYHQKNVETGIDVDDFLRPYQHVDELLRERSINVYNPRTNRLMERATLEAEYKEFLHRLRKDKPYILIAHDVAVLDCVRSLRNTLQSTLEAGTLLVTCDYVLYRFDSESSRNAKTSASVVLPNVLWQVLRPFIPASQDFDRSFAETFAIPEFRTIGSDASKACSKMLGLLAAYKDFPEETAARLLSNDMLINSLRTVEDDEQFREQVESAIAAENQVLLEERAALAKQVESLKAEKERAELEVGEEKHLRTDAETRLAGVEMRSIEVSKQLEIEHNNLAEANSCIQKLEQSARDWEKMEAHKRLVRSAIGRAALAFVILVVIEAVIGLLVWRYGEGHNLFQKLTSAWPWLALGFTSVAVLYPFLMGRDRMRMLKWWKGEIDSWR
ncbi:MAG: hypothetical protein LAO31_11780 [Acidobacteriia bacterium]|nr:hypothetical protein [Terriglobia bacterium]